MQCSCGGLTLDRTVTRNKEVVGEFAECSCCGRTSWLWKLKSLQMEIEAEKTQLHARKLNGKL